MPVQDQFATIHCPGCGKTLVAAARTCQFCGADTKAVARPEAPGKKHYAEYDTPRWIWTVYYCVAVWWIIGGAADVLGGLYVFGKPLETLKLEKEFGVTQGPDYVLIISGALTAFFGLGLAARLEIIRGIVNFVAGIKLIFGLIALAFGLMGVMFAGLYAVPFILMDVADVISAGLLLWLIGETDMRPPNI